MAADRVDAKLAELGRSWPTPPEAVASYLPCVRDGSALVISGQLPFQDGELVASGAVPSVSSPEQAKAAAAQCALNALSILRRAIDGDWDRVERVVRVGVFVASDAGFDGQSAVADGASDLIVSLLGEAGRHARVAVGCVALPRVASVELELRARLRA